MLDPGGRRAAGNAAWNLKLTTLNLELFWSLALPGWC